MTTNTSAIDSPHKTSLILCYFGALTFLITLAGPTGYFLDITVSYMLKNQLNLSAADVSKFRFLIAIPVYFGFVFGLARDQWNPFGMRDRGYFLLFAMLSVCVFILLSQLPISAAMLSVGFIALMISSRFLNAAYQGLMALTGQEQLMSGRLASAWVIILNAPNIAGAWGSGYFVEHNTPRATFFLWRQFCSCCPGLPAGSLAPFSATPTINLWPKAPTLSPM